MQYVSAYRPIVYKNVLDSAQAVAAYMRKVGLECDDFSTRIHCERILGYQLDDAPGSSASNPYFSPEIADAIHQFWKDPMIQNILDNFFGEVLRIGTPGYLPDETDVLRARQKSLGIAETRFTMGQLSIHMFDVGRQCFKRKKCIHCFESVTSIIFCAALSAYDQVLLEEKLQNRMTESLILFESVINSRWFLRAPIILFLNKLDVFKKKFCKVRSSRLYTLPVAFRIPFTAFFKSKISPRAPTLICLLRSPSATACGNLRYFGGGM